MTQQPSNPDRLIDAALAARKHARAHHSGYPVGAAIEDADGRIWTGVNVESSSYGLSCCAERVALFKALSEGVSDFRSVAVVAGGPRLATPCGACRQVLHDYAPGLEVFLHNPDTGDRDKFTLQELIPAAFESSQLDRGDKA